MIAVTAFEARDLNSLRKSSQLIAYFISALYLFCVIGELLNVEWTNKALPEIFGGLHTDHVEVYGGRSRSRAIIIIAAIEAGYPKMAGFLNGCMIFAALSASNTALYVASRSLYGMTRTIRPWKCFRALRVLGSVWHRNGVPMWALLISAVAFVWLPFLELKGGYAIADVRYYLVYSINSMAYFAIASRNHEYNLLCKLSTCLGFSMLSIHTLSCLVSQHSSFQARSCS